MNHEASGPLESRAQSHWWPILLLTLLGIQAAFAIMVVAGASQVPNDGIVRVLIFLPLLLGTGVSVFNAIHSGRAIRLFWSFFGLSCMLWALNSSSWIYYVALLRKDHPVYLFANVPLFLQPIFLIAAVASRPHVKLSRDKPYRTTTNFLQLLFFWVFTYAFVLCPISYMQWDTSLLQRAGILYAAENFLLIAVLGAAVVAVGPPWKGIYRQLFGASALYTLGSLAKHVAIVSGTSSAGLDDLLNTAAACWFGWIALRGRRLASHLAESVQTDSVHPKYASTLAMVAVAAIPIVGIWELFRVHELYSTRAIRLFIVLLAIFCLAVTAFITQYFSKREWNSDTERANQRLRMAMASGKSVGWELDLATGEDSWFGDLRNMFGIEADTFTGRMEDFYSYLHPDDHQHVTQVVTDARVNHKPYEAEFRIVRRDGAIRWVSARGTFYYAKDGHPERMLGMAVDITERKHAEDALKSSEEKYSRAFRESPMALTLTSAKDHHYIEVNDTFLQITGWQLDEVIGRTPFDLQIWVNPADRLEFVKHVQAEGSVRDVSIRFRCKDGTVRFGLGSAELIEIDNEPCIISVIADVTDRMQFEEKLHESEERLRGVVESAMDAIIAIDEEQHIVLFNTAAERMFGCSAQDALGTPLDRFIPERYRVEHASHVHSFGTSGVTNRAPGKLKTLSGLRANGEEFPIDASISKVDTGGKKLFTVIVRDMTERRRIEAAQRKSEERLHLAVQAGKMYAYEWDAATDRIVRSPECLDILGSNQLLETSRREILAQVHPDDRELFGTLFTGITLDNPTSHVSCRFLRSDGGVMWQERRARAFFDDKGKLLRTIGVVVDITDRRQAEVALCESEERFRRVVEHIGDAVVVDDVAGNLVFANDRFLQLFGFDREQIPHLKIYDCVAPEHRAELQDRHQRRMRGETVPTHFEFEGLRRDGKRMWLEVDVVPIASQTGNVGGTQSALRDVTERKHAEQLLQESEERFRLVANTAPVMIWMAGPDKLCTYVNQPWLNFTGRTIEEELGKGWSEGIHPEDLNGCIESFHQAFEQRLPFTISFRARRHDGEYRWILDTAVPRFERCGSFAGYIGSCIDVTVRKLAEEALATMGRRLIEAHEEERTWIARELHDDINQRLALLAIELDQWNQHVPGTAGDLRTLIQHGRKRLFDISKDVQSLSHRLHSSKLEYLGITAAANGFCNEYSEQQKVQVEFSHSDIPRSMPAEVSLSLFRVLQESLQNAAKHSRSREFKVELRGTPDEVHLTVSDPGVGFDQAAALTGRGIGLISMRERLQLVNGSLEIESEPGHGTTVRARVPIKSKSQQDRITLAG